MSVKAAPKFLKIRLLCDLDPALRATGTTSSVLSVLSLPLFYDTVMLARKARYVEHWRKFHFSAPPHIAISCATVPPHSHAYVVVTPLLETRAFRATVKSPKMAGNREIFENLTFEIFRFRSIFEIRNFRVLVSALPDKA